MKLNLLSFLNKKSPRKKSLEELNRKAEWFFDPSRSDNEGPFIIIEDNFYADPLKIRQLALSQKFFQYSPPTPEQVGEKLASTYRDPRPAWISSSLLRFKGNLVNNPQPGFRYAPDEVREKIGNLLGENVNADTWNEMGDWWNGAFHVQFDNWTSGRGAIHHHYKDGDVAPRGWSGLIYLTPNAPKEAGTSIWRSKSTGLCIASKGSQFYQKAEDFELAYSVENKFNRLVLFRENVLHRAEQGFGKSVDDGRLTQTFFFHSEKHVKLSSD